MTLCQAFQATSPSGLHRHLQDTADELGMTAAALGPHAPGAASGSEHHTAILVRGTARLRLLDTGPAVAYQP